MDRFMTSLEMMMATATILISKLGMLPHCDDHTLFIAKSYSQLTFFYNKIENIRELLDMVDGQEEHERDEMILVLNKEFQTFFRIIEPKYTHYLDNINQFMQMIGDLDVTEQLEYMDAATTIQVALEDLRVFVIRGNKIESPEQLTQLIVKE